MEEFPLISNNELVPGFNGDKDIGAATSFNPSSGIYEGFSEDKESGAAISLESS